MGFSVNHHPRMLLVDDCPHFVVWKLVILTCVGLPILGFSSLKDALVHLLPLIDLLEPVPWDHLLASGLHAALQSRIVFPAMCRDGFKLLVAPGRNLCLLFVLTPVLILNFQRRTKQIWLVLSFLTFHSCVHGCLDRCIIFFLCYWHLGMNIHWSRCLGVVSKRIGVHTLYFLLFLILSLFFGLICSRVPFLWNTGRNYKIIIVKSWIVIVALAIS